MDYEKIAHSGKFCLFHRNFAVIRTGNDLAEPEIEKGVPVAGDDPQGKVGRAQSVGQGAVVGGQLLTGWSIEPVIKPGSFQAIGGCAPPVWRTEHDHPPQVVGTISVQGLPDNDPPQGVGDEMYGRWIEAFTAFHPAGQAGGGDFFYGEVGGRIAEVDSMVSCCSQSLLHLLHGSMAAGHAVEQDDTLSVGLGGDGGGDGGLSCRQGGRQEDEKKGEEKGRAVPLPTVTEQGLYLVINL